ncbi:hypothetical protein ASG32_07910 [Methylobacterium sp. Leaf361]|uniref:hypothetical protein n=1 Tax=Methylobacterium sp. Leaf361 TaxID=1736352 RepID=UPI0006F8D1B3|nr:hypothetical protein [Methylobacterium sp. Leaf361]KQS75012.1 hypothetical protein ASG32_07910 [Methylobacterium sp. Leaf361]
MSYTVKLAIFPPWKAPIPYETLIGVFATAAEAAGAGAKALEPVTERELADLASSITPRSQRVGEGWATAIEVPDWPIHGYLIYDKIGVEVHNWTTLDVAVERAAKG